MMTLVLPLTSPLVASGALRESVQLWCRERIIHGLIFLPREDGYDLIFSEIADLLAFKARWIA